MRWEQVNLEPAEWRYIVSKTGTDHLVPLSRQAVALLTDLHLRSSCASRISQIDGLLDPSPHASGPAAAGRASPCSTRRKPTLVGHKARRMTTMDSCVVSLRWLQRRAHDEHASLRRLRAGTIPDTSRTQE